MYAPPGRDPPRRLAIVESGDSPEVNGYEQTAAGAILGHHISAHAFDIAPRNPQPEPVMPFRECRTLAVRC